MNTDIKKKQFTNFKFWYIFLFVDVSGFVAYLVAIKVIQQHIFFLSYFIFDIEFFKQKKDVIVLVHKYRYRMAKCYTLKWFCQY